MKVNSEYFSDFNAQRITTWLCLGQAALKKLLKKLRSCLEALNSGLVICNFTLFYCLPRLRYLECLFFFVIFLHLNRYEEVEVRKKLEEKERQEEKKRKEEITEKDSGQSSPKASAANKKDSKKVWKHFYTYEK